MKNFLKRGGKQHSCATEEFVAKTDDVHHCELVRLLLDVADEVQMGHLDKARTTAIDGVFSAG